MEGGTEDFDYHFLWQIKPNIAVHCSKAAIEGVRAINSISICHLLILVNSSYHVWFSFL